MAGNTPESDVSQAEEELLKLKKILGTSEGKIKVCSSNSEVQMCFLLYKLILAKSVYDLLWKVQLTKPMKNWCTKRYQHFVSVLSTGFRDFSLAQGRGWSMFWLLRVQRQMGRLYLPDFAVWQLYPLVCICCLSVSSTICSFSLNKQVYNS